MDAQSVESISMKVARWAAAQPDVLALALVGSYAKGYATEDSDIDLVLISRNPGRFLEDGDWITQFGKIEKCQLEYYGLVTSLRIWFAEGYEIEFGVTGERWVADPLDSGTSKVIQDGMRILFERDNILSLHRKTVRVQSGGNSIEHLVIGCSFYGAGNR